MYTESEVGILLRALAEIIKQHNRYDSQIAKQAVDAFEAELQKRRARHDADEAEHEHRAHA